jgi:O-antigen/teichoic acid export membrane protein
MLMAEPQAPGEAAGATPVRAAASATLEGRAARGAALSSVGFVIGQALRLASNLALTRLLFEEAFGLMALVQVFITGVQLFSDLGLGPSLIQNRRGDEPAFFNTAFTLQATRGLGLWVVSMLGAVPFAALYGEPRLAWMVPVAGFTAVLDGLTSTKLATANRRLALGRLTLVELGGQAAALAVTLTWAALRPSVWALVAGGVVNAGVRALLSHLALPGPGNRLAWDPAAARALLRFGRWIFVSTVLTFLAGQSDRLVFGKLVPLERLGVYSVAIMLAALPAQGLGTMARKVLFPLWSRVHDEGGDLGASYRRARWPLLVLGGWITAGLVAGGPTVVRLLYDDRYREAGWMLPVIAVGGWFGVLLENTNGMALLARGLARWTAAGSAAKLVGLYTLIPAGFLLGGLRGALVGIAAAELGRYAVSSFAARSQGLRALDQDGLLTLLLALSSVGGWLVAAAARGHGAPVALEAAAVFVVVSLLWAPLWLPLLRARARRGRAA